MEEDKRVSSDATESATAAPGGESASSDKSAAAAQDAGVVAKEELARLQAEVQTLRTENEELKDKSLRVVAEMENFRRRTERDKADFAKYAISEFARDVLSVADNMRRAIEAVPKDALGANPAVKSVVEGVEVTERELLKVLERYQVTRFDPLGEPFNPHLHDAMTKVDVPNVPAETVVQVIHAGYMIGERVLRPAAVIVAKGGTVEQMPKPSADGAPDNIPLGAMKIPDDAVSSASTAIEPAHVPGRVDVQQTVFGRHLSGEKRRSSLADDALADERVANFRRARPANNGGAGGGNHDAGRHQQGGGGGGHKPASLHKPIIQKQD